MFRDRLSRATRRPFSLATELRVLAVGLFAVAGAALWFGMSGSAPIGPGDVLAASGIIVGVFVVNVTVGLAAARKAARRVAAEAVEN
jgi:hypothetical protein